MAAEKRNIFHSGNKTVKLRERAWGCALTCHLAARARINQCLAGMRVAAF